MAELVPLKAVYDGSSICGLSELRDGDVVGVEHGGLGVCTIPSNTLLIGNGQGAISTTSALTTNGQIIIGGTGGPQIANLTGTSNEVEITDGNGAITIGLPATVQIATNLKTPAFSITNEYCLPTSDGSAGQIMCTNGSGALAFVDFDGTGHCIAFSGTTVADRTCLNFLGGGVTVSDNSGTNATDITIPVTTPELKVRNTSGSELSIQLDNAAIGGELICDTTPQLGGTLDVNGYAISSVSNCNISISPNGTGSVILDGLSWPQADGTAGYILCTDGSGSLSWAADAAGGSAAGSNNEIQYNSSGSFGASSNLTFDGSTLTAAGNVSAYIVSLDSISSRTGTGIGVTLGDDAGDDFAVDGTKLVVEGDTGKVGIGTAAPDHIFHVQDVGENSFNTKAVFDLENTRRSGYTQAALELAPASSAGAFRTRAIAAELIGDQTASDLVFYSESTEHMRIDSSGKVGIGTNSPVHQFEVEAAGNTLHTYMGSFKTTVGTYNLQTEGTHGGVTGTVINNYQNSSSPADGDFAGMWNTDYKDSAGNRVQVGSFGWFVTDVTAGTIDSYFYLRVKNNNSSVAGTMSSSGVWTDSSAAVNKEYYGTRQEVWPDGVLDSLKTLNVSKYKQANLPDSKLVTETHVSPTAEDFWDTFQIGQDPRREMLNAEGEQILNPSIAPKDLSGMALVAIQELLDRVEAAEAKLEATEAKIAVLESA